MFKKGKRAEQSPEATRISYSQDCKDTSVCIGSASEVDKQSEFLLDTVENLSEATEDWFAALDTARDATESLKNVVDATAATTRRQNNLTSNAPLDWWIDGAGTFTGKPVDVIAQIRQNAKEHVYGIAQNELHTPYETILASKNPKMIQRALEGYQSHARMDIGQLGYPFYVDFSGEKYQSPYCLLFTHEARARLSLAHAITTNPDTMREVLDPATIAELPESLQALLAVDLTYGKKSVVRSYLYDGDTKDGGTDETTFEEYLTRGVTNPEAKRMVELMQLGARAAGSCVCVMNEIGLCKQVAGKISTADLPLLVQKDMVNQDRLLLKAREQVLETIMSKQGVSRWYRLGDNIQRQNMSDVGTVNRSAKNHRQRGANTTPSAGDLEASIRRTNSREIVLPSKGFVVVDGESYPIPVLDEAAIEEVVRHIMKSEVAQRYITTYHNQDNINQFLEKAFTTIVAAPNYREVAGLLPMSYAKKLEASDGEKLGIWRLSGKDFQGVSGKLVRDTRIYFGVSNAQDTRRIQVIDVVHKTAVEKASKTGTLYV